MKNEKANSILAYLRNAFPSFAAQGPTTAETLGVWENIFTDYELEKVIAAVGEFIQTANSAHAPSASQILAIIREQQKAEQRQSRIFTAPKINDQITEDIRVIVDQTKALYPHLFAEQKDADMEEN